MDTDILGTAHHAGPRLGRGQVTERLRERRTAAREQLARHAELQRATLLELQVMLLDLWLGVLGSMDIELGFGFDGISC
jgi:hypothetical protein